MTKITPAHRLAEALALRELQCALAQAALEAALSSSTTFRAAEGVHQRLLKLQTHPLLGDGLAPIVARTSTACTRPELIAIASELQTLVSSFEQQLEAMLVDETPPLEPGEIGGQPRC